MEINTDTLMLKHKKDFPKAYIKKRIKEAYAYSLSIMKDKKRLTKGTTITKSISAKKKRPKKI